MSTIKSTTNSATQSAAQSATLSATQSAKMSAQRRHAVAVSRVLPLLLTALLAASVPVAARDALASWRTTETRQAIVACVDAATDENSSSYVPVAERIAVFDNDGTLWSEQPAYFQVLFAIDRARAMLKADPALAAESPFKELASGGPGAVLKGGESTLLLLLARTHTGISEAAFAAMVDEWISTARHPVSGRPYTEMIFQPMLELMDYLRDEQFQVWIVSGGTVSFMRPWAEQVYGIAPENIVGTRFAIKYENGQLLREPSVAHVNDKAGKPVGIQQQIGRRPVIAVGNSDGDFEMLEWTTSGERPALGLIVHHTDAAREWAYDRESAIGKLDRGLREAEARGWTLIDMQTDWSKVYPWNSPKD